MNTTPQDNKGMTPDYKKNGTIPTPQDDLDERIDEIFLQYHAELNQGLNELAGHGTAREQAKAKIKALLHTSNKQAEIELLKDINRNSSGGGNWRRIIHQMLEERKGDDK